MGFERRRNNIYVHDPKPFSTFNSILYFPQTITGCFPKIKQLIDDNTVVIVGVALGIAALEV